MSSLSKKILLRSTICIAIAVVAYAGFFLLGQYKKLSPLLQYVPSNVQQVVLLQSDRILALLGNDATNSANPMYQTLSETNNIGLLQFSADNTQEQNAIIVDAKKSFDANTFLTNINAYGDTDYTFHKYNNVTYLFASPDTIQTLVSSTIPTLQNTSSFMKLRPLIEGKDGIFISHLATAIGQVTDPTVAQFVSKSDAFVMTLATAKKGLAIDAHLIYKESQTGFILSDFKPSLTQFIDKDTIAFLETKGAGLWTQDDKKMVISAVRSFDPFVVSGMTDDDIRTISNAPLALILQNSPTISDLRIALLMGTAKAYPIIRQLFPLLQEPLEALVGLETGMLQATEEKNRIAYETTLFGLMPIVLQAYDKDNMTVVSLGASTPLQSTNTHKMMTPPKGSIGYIFVQFDPLLALYKQFGAMAGQNKQDPLFIQQEKMLQGKILEGYVQSSADRISFYSTIQ